MVVLSVGLKHQDDSEFLRSRNGMFRLLRKIHCKSNVGTLEHLPAHIRDSR